VDETRHERIRAAVAAIPEGSVATYGQVAAEVGEASARLVGRVLREDGADLPWHRVLRADGSSAPRILDEQHQRLRAEGVEIRDGRVVLENHRVASGWIPRG
jgi:alkylated DNA nucleotide flippase Atl1